MSSTTKVAARKRREERPAQPTRHVAHSALWIAVLSCVALWGSWPAQSQDGGANAARGAEAASGAVGEVIFKDLPPHVDNLGQTGFHWRVPAVPKARTTRPPLDQMVVVLSHEEEKRSPEDITAVVKGYRIEPRVIVAAPNTTLHVEHQGQGAIHIEAVGRGGIKPLTLDEPGHQAKLSLDKPGRYILQATEYTSVLTYVIVTDSIAESTLQATSRDRAQFNLGDVPAGRYELKIYYQGKLVLEEKVEVNAEGALNKPGFLLNREDWQRVTQLP